MCECGCGEFYAEWTMPAPAGNVYLIRVYPGCANGCDTPAGVEIVRIKPSSEWGKNYEADKAKPAKFVPLGGGRKRDAKTYGSIFVVPVVHSRHIQRQLGDDGDSLFDDGMLVDAVCATQKDPCALKKGAR